MTGPSTSARPNVDLRAERLNKGLSIRGAAREADVSATSIDRAERGESVRIDIAYKIAEFYGYQVTDIWPVPDREAAA